MKAQMRRAAMSGLLAVVASLATMAGAAAWAYEEITVANGGTVTGGIRFTGTVPAPDRFELRRYYDRVYCGALSDGSGYRLLKEVFVGSQGQLKDVIVTVEGVAQGKPFTLQETNLEANMCQFVPFVSALRKEHALRVVNLDSVAHDLQFYERDEQGHIFIMFHRPALTKGGTSDLVRTTGNRRSVTMQCGMHPYMQGHGLVVENPYYAITGEDGMFRISDIPPGQYQLKAWHPILGEQSQPIRVAENGTVTVGFTFEGK
jgi:hypothetical protein